MRNPVRRDAADEELDVRILLEGHSRRLGEPAGTYRLYDVLMVRE
jgi:hypothetical protein